MDWKGPINAFLLNLIKQSAQVIIDVAMQPGNVDKYKMAYRSIWQETAITAPKKGRADEELEDKIDASGMESVLLPDDFKP